VLIYDESLLFAGQAYPLFYVPFYSGLHCNCAVL